MLQVRRKPVQLTDGWTCHPKEGHSDSEKPLHLQFEELGSDCDRAETVSQHCSLEQNLPHGGLKPVLCAIGSLHVER